MVSTEEGQAQDHGPLQAKPSNAIENWIRPWDPDQRLLSHREELPRHPCQILSFHPIPCHLLFSHLTTTGTPPTSRTSIRGSESTGQRQPP